jgi:hypothetical protein
MERRHYRPENTMTNAAAVAEFTRLTTRHLDLVNRALYSRPLTAAEDAELVELEEAIDALCEVAS